jgi:hypothetical protein
MLTLLVNLLVLALIIWAAYFILDLIRLPEPAKTIVTVILAVIFVMILLGRLGIAI